MPRGSAAGVTGTVDGGRGLSIRLLGPLRAFVDGRELPLGPPLQRALFAVLAIRGNQVVYSSELIDAVWGDDIPGRAKGGVHTYIAGLRRALEPDRAHRSPGRYLESCDSSGYRLNIPGGGTDLARFEELRAAGRRAWAQGEPDRAQKAFADAIALFDGTALGGVPGPFAEAQRGRLAERLLTVLEDRMDALLAGGRHAEAAGELSVLTLEHPLRERPWAQLMLALYREGRQADALAAFERARKAAVDELGLDPGPLLTDLRQRIVVGDPSLAAAGPPGAAAGRHNLPRDVDRFTGRDREVAAVLTLAEPSSPAVCAIDGMAGVGKTTLAVHAAHQLGDRYPDAWLYLDLHAHSPGQKPVSAAEALEKLLLAMEVPGDRIPAHTDDRAGLWRARLAGLRMLVVLDNAADAAQVRPLLPGSPGSLVLITSRRRLVGLDGGACLSLDVLPDSDAVALFAAVAGPGRTAAAPEAVAAVVRRCGNLPLAVQIAAARLRHRPAWGVADLLARLDDEERRLSELRVEDRSVAAAFSLSYRSLPPDRRRVFRLLGLFPGAQADLRAAAALAGTGIRSADEVLEDLVDAHLLDETGPGRFRLHDLLGVFAARQCRDEDGAQDRRAALGRLLDFYLHSVDNAEELLRPQRLDRAEAPAEDTLAYEFEDRAQALAWLEGEHANFVPIVRTAAEHGFDRHAWQIARYLWGFFDSRGHRADWIACHELALPSTRRLGDRLAEARILVGLGVAEHLLRRYGEAVGHYRSALVLMQEVGFRSGEAGVLTNLGNSYCNMGRLADGIACHEQSLETCRQIKDQTSEAIALANLGELYRDAGRFPESAAALEQALVMFRKSGDRRLEGSVLDGLGRTSLAMGRHGEALAHCLDALETRRGCGDRYGEAGSLDCLGQVYRATGQAAEARRAWREALAIAEELDAPIAGDVRARLAGLGEAG